MHEYSKHIPIHVKTVWRGEKKKESKFAYLFTNCGKYWSSLFAPLSIKNSLYLSLK